MRTPLLTVTNDAGRTFVVRYVPTGARYGRANVLTNDDAPMVEWYDATYADDCDGDYAQRAPFGFGPLGQFVSRYFVSTMDRPGGLILDGENRDAWSVDAATVERVRRWMVVAATEAAASSR